MKKVQIIFFIPILILTGLLSCKRVHDAPHIRESGFTLEDAKNWFARNVESSNNSLTGKTSFRRINGLPENRKTLLWKFAIQRKNKQVEAAEVPYTGTATVFELPDSVFTSIAQKEKVIAATAKRVVIYKKPSGAVDLMLVHIVPDLDYLSKHPNHSRSNFFLTLDNEFTGWIYTYDWNENAKSVSQIRNGKLVQGRNRIVKDSSTSQTNNRYEYMCFQVCTLVFIGTSGANCGNPGDPHYDDCVYNSQNATGNWINYCRWECGYVWIPNPPSGGNGGGDNPPNDCNYYGTCDPGDMDCSAIASALDNLTGVSTSLLLYNSVEEDPNNPAKRNIVHKWEFFKCITPTGDIQCVSWEKGEQNKVDGRWKWISFYHDTHSVLNNAGIFFTGTITALSAANNILDPFGYAKVDLSYTVDVKASCGPIPLHTRSISGQSGSRVDVNSF